MSDTNGAVAGAVANGQLPREFLEEKLTDEPLSAGYKATLPYWALGGFDSGIAMPQVFLLRDIELMLIHPMVRCALNYFKSGIAGAEFWGGPDPANSENEQGVAISQDPTVSAFVTEQCNRFWDRGVPHVQDGYDYGWMGAENLYDVEDGAMKWKGLRSFSPCDTFILTQDYKPIGVRVKKIQNKGEIDLWLASQDVPAKALWYAHEPRYSSYYGVTQLLGAWRPWRRLAWKDAAETVLDTGVYRYAFAGPIGRYPENDPQVASQGVPATAYDSQGRPRRYNRDVMRQMVELYKTGAGIGMSSACDDKGNYLWDMQLPEHVLNVDPIINYVKMLKDEISLGIGVPPELIEAADTGSGYSGRKIPMQAFLAQQQRIADRILMMFVEQVLRPLVAWNFGQAARFNVMVKSLLKTREKESGENQQQPSGQQGQQQPGSQGGGWKPVTGDNGQGQGWESQGGRRIYQPQMPGQAMSLFVTDRVRDIGRRAIEAARRAA